ncbi:MAG: hypothetical protein M1465_02145 [Candidatus Marsarchaeota archaeon]|jgi:hypothetical protein|nr:hypothetical protein [Candidatus Marsarchaeota archaeon]
MRLYEIANIKYKPLRKYVKGISEYAAVFLYSVSIVSSIYYLPLSASAFMLAIAVQKLSKHGYKGRDKFVISDTFEMMKSMSAAKKKPRYSNILSSMPRDFKHYNLVKRSLVKFKLTGDAESSFGEMLGSVDKRLRDIGTILYSSFITGSDISGISSWFIKKNSSAMRYGMRILPLAENSELMLSSGINFFFPLFAGITINIIKFSSPGAYASSYLSMFAIFIFYIITVNYATLKNSFAARDGYFIKVLSLTAFASLAMQLAVRVSSFML